MRAAFFSSPACSKSVGPCVLPAGPFVEQAATLEDLGDCDRVRALWTADPDKSTAAARLPESAPNLRFDPLRTLFIAPRAISSFASSGNIAELRGPRRSRRRQLTLLRLAL
jgi:hypothetical protein